MPPPRKAAPGKSQMLRRDPLASLKVVDIMAITKPILPAEILVVIVDYLTVPDLLRFARVSRRMHEMVYDDSRWVQRLQRMDCWNEADARRYAEVNEQTSMKTSARRRQSTLDRTIVNGKGRPGVLFDATKDSVGFEVQKPIPIRSTRKQPTNARVSAAGGFDNITASDVNSSAIAAHSDLEAALTVLEHVKSVRGKARQEYSKVYRALGRFYSDAVETTTPLQCLIFRLYSSPEHQAMMLSQLRIFAQSDFSPGSSFRERCLATIMNMFDTAALLEFRKGYEYKDIQGRMRQYAHVMHILNGGRTSIDLYLHDNRLIAHKSSLGSATDCIDYSLGYGQLSLGKVQTFFDRLGNAYAQEDAIIQQAFPTPQRVSIELLQKAGRDIISPFLSSLFIEAQSRGNATYLRTVSSTFAQTRQFLETYATVRETSDESRVALDGILVTIFESHLDLYLADEMAAFKQKADSEIDQWDKALSEQAASTETFLMSNINRQADKKDFLSSFKKVIMMPVSILPNFSAASSSKVTAKALVIGDDQSSSNVPTRSTTPVPNGNPLITERLGTPLPLEAPTTELAAKAAIMSSKLENIRSLFSIEVALNLVHAAKSSLERVAQFNELGGDTGHAAKTQCVAIFVLLLHSVGVRHVKAGFDKAIDHLSAYNPRAAAQSGDSEPGGQVAPLATFLELVNMGDLIQQMLAVFYESELVRLHISNRDDFLDPSFKEKRKFEAMLDERVAAGLGKGIDVLMDEVEFICATTQLPTDFNPINDSFDIGPTHTAEKIVDIVGTHTSILSGSTDKTLLDVFSSEVGLRLWTTLCKHIKRQRISTRGALPLLSDLGAYAAYIAGYRNHDLDSYFVALREVGQIFLIEGSQAGEMAAIISDAERYHGVFTVDEVLEFAERRSDWLLVKGKIEKAMYGQCVVM